MYEAYYGFKEKPFSMLPDPGFLYLSKKHQTALTLLEYGLFNNVGFCVISGEPGAGKTTILRAMLERVSDDVTVGLITNTHQSFGGLLDWILSVFDLHRPDLSQVEMHQVFMDYLIDEYANNRSVLLIVDEAQNMSADSLEELRMLSNVNSEKDQLLQVVLVGQPGLKELLRKPELMQFAQRIAVDYHLAPLSLEETCGYIQHRLVVAGVQRDIFTPAACERIYRYSGGTPRLINLLCETALVFGFADQTEEINVELVEEMVQERMKDSVVPFIKQEVDEQDTAEVLKELEKTFPRIDLIKDDLTGDSQSNNTQEVEKKTADEKSVAVESSQSISEETESDATKAQSEQEQPELDSQDSDALLRVSHQIETQNNVEPDHKPAAVSSSSVDINITGEAIPPANTSADTESNKVERMHYVQYGIAAVAIAVILILIAIVLSSNDGTTKTQPMLGEQKTERSDTEGDVQQQQAREAAEKEEARLAAEAAALEQLKQEQAEKERLEKERLEQEKIKKEKAAIAAREKKEKQRLEQERLEKQRAEKKRAEQQRLAREKEEARLAREAKYAEEREKRKAALLEEEKRLQAEKEAIRLEREYLEAQKKAQEKAVLEAKAASSSAASQSGSVAEKKARKEENVPDDCKGPTARFKSYCR